jgi:hypothetical protein
VSSSEIDYRQAAEQPSPVKLYCMAAMVADEASREGHKGFAHALEAALNTFLASLSREEQGIALRLSYELAMGGADTAPPRLRLVYSRD